MTGKWLVPMDCPYWGLIRDATRDGTLGISSKISTDWAMKNDPSGTWRKHVVCVYTTDWRQREDVLRVATRLHEIGAVKKAILYCQPDVFTTSGRYEGNAAGGVAIYSCRPPYRTLVTDAQNIAVAESLLR